VTDIIRSAIPQNSIDLAIRARKRFDQFLSSKAPRVSFAEATFPLFLEFLHSLYAVNLKASTVSAYARGIEISRASCGLPPFKQLEPGMLEAFQRGVAKAKPTHSKYIGTVPFAPKDLLNVLLERLAADSESFTLNRNLTLFLLRCECVMRASEAATVLRSSIRAANSPANAPCTVFNYSTKGAAARNIATDSNYCACICALRGGKPICPACHLLRLKTTVDALPLAASHDCVFTDSAGRSLSRDRVRTIITSLMRDADLPAVMTAHSLRHAVNQALQLGGVDESHVALRAGWSTAASNATQRSNYTYHRFVKPVFAKVLFL